MSREACREHTGADWKGGTRGLWRPSRGWKLSHGERGEDLRGQPETPNSHQQCFSLCLASRAHSNTQVVSYFLAKALNFNSTAVLVIPGPPVGQKSAGAARLWAAPRHQASAWPCTTCPHIPRRVPPHLQLIVSPILSPLGQVSRQLQGENPRLSDGSGARAAASAAQQTLSPPGSFGLKETRVFEILSLRVLVWLQVKQQPLLVEGETGFASRRVEDFVMRARPRAQPGLMAVTRGHGHRLRGTACFSRASLLTRLFSGRCARCSCGTKSACHPVRGGP